MMKIIVPMKEGILVQMTKMNNATILKRGEEVTGRHKIHQTNYQTQRIPSQNPNIPQSELLQLRGQGLRNERYGIAHEHFFQGCGSIVF